MGRGIILLAHSYNSILTCEAVKGLGHQERLMLGKFGGVVRLVFIAADYYKKMRAEPSGRNCTIQDGNSMGKVRGELLFDLRYQLSRLRLTLPASTGWPCLRRRSYLCSPQRHIRRRRSGLGPIHLSIRPCGFCNPAEIRNTSRGATFPQPTWCANWTNRIDTNA